MSSLVGGAFTAGETPLGGGGARGAAMIMAGSTSGEPAECVAGAKRCDETARSAQVCSAEGSWTTTQCEFVCLEGACSGRCLPGARQCDAARPQRCNDSGQWVADGQECPAECQNGVCVGACRSGATQCTSSERMQTCVGGQWGPNTSCEFACANDECGGVCVPGDTRCANAASVQLCGAVGQWGAPSSCEFVCSGKACGGQCKPGALRCSSNTTLQTCNDQGTWGSPTTCTNACVNNACGGSCRPGAKRCGQPAGTLETCNDAGQWTASTCPSACVNGACTTCSPGATECVSNTRARTCAANGAWGAASECANACVGGACGGTCKPGARECVSGAEPQYRTCSDTGQSSAAVSCAPSPACVNGTCGTDPKIVFVTSTRYTGALGGVSGADQKCNDRAKAGSQPGTYRAWISDDSQSPATRFSLRGGPLRLVDGSEIAKTWAALFESGPSRPINLTELGGRPPVALAPPGTTVVPCGSEETVSFVWSDTNNRGLRVAADRNCVNWTTTESNRLHVGRTDNAQRWTSYCTVNANDEITNSCAMQAPLYCFQQ